MAQSNRRSKQTTGTKHRRNWALPEATVKDIEDIRDVTNCVTDTEVIRRAVRFYQMAVKNEQSGIKIVFRDADGREREVIFA